MTTVTGYLGVLWSRCYTRCYKIAIEHTSMIENQNGDPRFRWSPLRQPGEGLVARGGVEPPTFRFSGGRSYQLSYLTWLGPQ